jgi:hypothetical protein
VVRHQSHEQRSQQARSLAVEELPEAVDEVDRGEPDQHRHEPSDDIVDAERERDREDELEQERVRTKDREELAQDGILCNCSGLTGVHRLVSVVPDGVDLP